MHPMPPQRPAGGEQGIFLSLGLVEPLLEVGYGVKGLQDGTWGWWASGWKAWGRSQLLGT